MSIDEEYGKVASRVERGRGVPEGCIRSSAKVLTDEAGTKEGGKGGKGGGGWGGGW